MEPLRTVFPRLKEKEVNGLIKIIQSTNESITCDVCKELLFEERECSTCPFKERKVQDVLIESFIPLALSIAKRLGGSNRKEVVSVSLLALTEAIAKMPNDIRSLEAYVRVFVAGKIKNFLLADSVIQVPRYGLATHSHLKATYAISGDIPVSGEQTAVDLNEIIATVPRNKNEEVILNCLLEGGYSLQDMSNLCGVGEARVSQVKQLVLDRLQTVLRKELT